MKFFLLSLLFLSVSSPRVWAVPPEMILASPMTNQLTIARSWLSLHVYLPDDSRIKHSPGDISVTVFHDSQQWSTNLAVTSSMLTPRLRLSRGTNHIQVLSPTGQTLSLEVIVLTPYQAFKLALDKIDSFMWGSVMMILLIATGIWLTIRTGGVQFRRLGQALRHTFSRQSLKGGQPGDITPFQALMTTLAATVGNGNIAGVATAIAAGGPGALFWMWLTALFGMVTRGAEAMLGVKFRKQAQDGSFIGGTFYYLEEGASRIIGKTPAKVLAVAFAIAGMAATFGIGNMVQANSVALSFNELFSISKALRPQVNSIIGIVLVVLTGSVLVFGIRGIGKVSARIVPLMSLLYLLSALVILILNITHIPAALGMILRSAFTGQAAVGGIIGISVAKAMKYGVARGIFSNEAGLGTGSLAHAAAQTEEPVRQGLVAMVETFIDTILICTMTGLVITLLFVHTGQAPLDSSGKLLSSTALTMHSFQFFLPAWGKVVVAVCSILFGYSTLIGWSYYGEQCTEYLLGVKSNLPYRLVFISAIYVGTVTELSLVWTLSDILNGFMAIPNLIGLLLLSGVVANEFRTWMKNNPARTSK